MQRNPWQIASILLALLVAIFAPVIASGYHELQLATTSKTYAEVARHYWNAAQRLPWRSDLYELSGHAYYYDKNYKQANAAYQRAFQDHSLSPDGWVAWGDVQYLGNDRARAVQTWEQGLEQPAPSEKLYSRLSQIYKEDGNYAKAAAYLQKYVALHQQDASARYRLGLLLTLSNPDAALAELIDASQLDPQLDPAVETLRSAINQASISDSPSGRLVLIGRGLGLVQEWGLARAAFASAIEGDEENAEAWAWLGESKQQTGADGADDLERAFQLNPDSSTVRGLRGLYFQRTGSFRNALTEFQTAALLDPQNPAWQVSIGETYSKLGDLIRALQAYQAATSLAPEDARYWSLLALFCAQNDVNINDVGVPAAQKAAALSERDSASLDLLGWLYLLDARYEDAEHILQSALKADPQNASAHLHLGMLYLDKGDRAAAYTEFAAARDLGNNDATAILNQYFP